MPQLAFETFVPQLIWLAIVFFTLYVLMSRLALPRIGKIIDGRQARITSDLSQASQLKAQTEEAIASYEAALASAQAKAHAIAQETRDRLTAQTDLQRAEIEAKLDEKIATAEAQIVVAKDEALSHVRNVAIDVTQAIVVQLIGEETDRALTESAVDSELK